MELIWAQRASSLYSSLAKVRCQHNLLTGRYLAAMFFNHVVYPHRPAVAVFFWLEKVCVVDVGAVTCSFIDEKKRAQNVSCSSGGQREGLILRLLVENI